MGKAYTSHKVTYNQFFCFGTPFRILYSFPASRPGAHESYSQLFHPSDGPILDHVTSSPPPRRYYECSDRIKLSLWSFTCDKIDENIFEVFIFTIWSTVDEVKAWGSESLDVSTRRTLPRVGARQMFQKKKPATDHPWRRALIDAFHHARQVVVIMDPMLLIMSQPRFP